MIETASLTSPSPKIILNNFGYLTESIIAKTHIESVEQIVAA
jgi:hypothetical protein